MKKYFILIFIILSYLSSLAVTPKELMALKPFYFDKYIRHGVTDTTIEIPVRFDEAQLMYADRISALSSRSIKRVTLYYTVYKLAQNFSQPELNFERFRNLQAAFPDLFQNSVVEWRVIGQTAPANAEEAKKLFHGFVFDFIAAPTLAGTKTEIRSITSLLKDKELGHDSVYYIENERFKKIKKWSGYYLPASKRKREKGIVYAQKGIWKRKKQMVIEYESVETKITMHTFNPNPDALKHVYKHISDSTIFAILNRNKTWTDMVFVVDVTGSMSPYTGQLFVWYKLNSAKRHVKNFTFFNDGDSKSDKSKMVGSTGGVYFTEAKEAEDVVQEGTQAMMRGSGGDAPENNCEAILNALQKNPDAKEIFMIADNYANMRDLNLAESIKKPVHILLCGSNNNFNTQYLDLARLTGGSVHTLEKDITDLMTLSEGDKIKLGQKWYRIKHGKFEQLYEM